MRFLNYLLMACLVMLPLLAGAASTPNGSSNAELGLDDQVQELKRAALELNRDLFQLEEELLFPSNTQISVFLSMDIGKFFNLDSVSLKIDGKEVANYLYTDREVDALIRGGVQRLHIGNLYIGEHELVASFIGKGPRDRDYKRGTTARITKSLGPKYVELKIIDKSGNFQPEFSIKEW